MPKMKFLTKILVCAGIVFIWLPILAPFILAFISIFSDGIFRFDYLIPAELFPFDLLGGCMLFWAAYLARSQRRLIGLGLVSMSLFLIVSQAAAVVTGLASGEAEASGWRLMLVMGLYSLFLLSLLLTAIGGLILFGKIFKKPIEQQSEGLPPP